MKQTSNAWSHFNKADSAYESWRSGPEFKCARSDREIELSFRVRLGFKRGPSFPIERNSSPKYWNSHEIEDLSLYARDNLLLLPETVDLSYGRP